MLVHLLGRPGEFVYIRLIMLVHLLGYALWGPAQKISEIEVRRSNLDHAFDMSAVV